VSAVAITGLGLVTALGAGLAENERALARGDSAIAPARRFDCSSYRSAAVAEVHGAGCAGKAALGAAAWREASAAAGLRSLPPGALLLLAGQVPGTDPGDADEFPTVPPPGLELDGVEVCFVSQACASVAFAIGFAREWLEAGPGSIAVVVAAAALNRAEYANMDVVRALSPTGARPFDVGRDGTSLGEGAVAVVLERPDHARERGAAALAAVAGAGLRVDPRGGRAQSSPNAIRDVVVEALEDAGVREVGYVHAHAAGTRQGDDAELDGLEAVAEERGWHDLRVGSSKGALGHLLHASAAPGLAAATLLFRRGTAAGTPNTAAAERRGRVRVLLEAAHGLAPGPVLVNSFGFAGNYASLVLTP
jgi:3-oxoacyl-[acyl-carrier-protein] synthase II